MKTCVVTCTGGRPELFALCRLWVERQAMRPDKWIVVTDTGEVPDLPSFAEHHHAPEFPALEPHRQAAYSLNYALSLVPQDHVAVIMEDDDWYAPNHVEVLAPLAEAHGLAVAGPVIYRFNLPAARFSIDEVKDHIEGWCAIGPQAMIDFRSNLLADPRRIMQFATAKTPTTVSIKGVGFGLPGRAGATRKHDPKHRKTRIMLPDHLHARFRETLRDDAHLYLELLR